MIRSESEYRDAVLQAGRGEARLAEYRKELLSRELSPEEIANVMGPMLSLREQLLADISCYDRIKNGDLGDFKDLRDIGHLLIAARIASGLGKRGLAQIMEVHESQVSRDEKNEYQGISVERAAQILEAMGIEVQIQSRLHRSVKGMSGSSPGDVARWDFDVPASRPPVHQEVVVEQDPRHPKGPHLPKAA